MKLFEYEGKNILRRFKVPVPQGGVARSPAEAAELTTHIGPPVMLKAQVLTGGRGKAGGIRKATSPEEAGNVAEEILSLSIRGEAVRALLIEQQLDIGAELCLSISVDRRVGKPLIMVSSQGGMNVEEVAAADPQAIHKRHVDVLQGLYEHESVEIAKTLGLRGDTLTAVSRLLYRLYQVFETCDAELVEINPLVIDRKGLPWAADAKMIINDNALYRQKDLLDPHRPADLNPLEREAWEKGLVFVDMTGSIALMGNGAGLTMAVVDLIHHYGGEAANFLDVGGGATPPRVRHALDLLLKKAKRDPAVKAILTVFSLAMVPADNVALGLREALATHFSPVPVHVVLNAAEEAEQARRMLAAVGAQVHQGVEEGIQATLADQTRVGEGG